MSCSLGEERVVEVSRLFADLQWSFCGCRLVLCVRLFVVVEHIGAFVLLFVFVVRCCVLIKVLVLVISFGFDCLGFSLDVLRRSRFRLGLFPRLGRSARSACQLDTSRPSPGASDGLLLVCQPRETLLLLASLPRCRLRDDLWRVVVAL